jgi:photosystem II stability/assembly factor-like uncharacterized protein
MKKSIITLLICFPLFSIAQSNWEIANTGIDSDFFCYDISAANGKVFSAGSKPFNNYRASVLYVSNDGALSWQEVSMNGKPPNIGLTDISYTGKRLIGTFGIDHPTGPMISDDDGKTWRLPLSGIDTINERVYSTIAVSPSNILALGHFTATGTKILYSSSDTGNTWTKKTVYTPLGILYNINVVEGKLFGYCYDNNYGYKVYMSDDMGANWKLLPYNFGGSERPDLIRGDGKNLHMFTNYTHTSMKIFTSHDSGQTWQLQPYSIKDNLSFSSVERVAHDNGVYYAALQIQYTSKMFVSRDKLSIPEPDYKMLNVFPNPASDQLNLRIQNAALNYAAEIFSMQGQYMGSFPVQDQSVDISALHEGIYLLKVFDGTNYYHCRFIKK